MIVLLDRRKPKRRWFQFRLRTMFCAVVVAALICGWPHLRRHYAFWRLHDYIGVDPQELTDEQRQSVDEWIALVLAPGTVRSDDVPDMYENWFLYRTSTPEKARTMYIIAMDRIYCFCRLYMIDHWGRPIGSIDFSAGYRVLPMSARLEKSEHGFLCLMIETDGVRTGETRQFYLVKDDHVELLRSEGLDGTMRMGRNNYFEIPVNLSDRPPWERLVASDDALDQLCGLAAYWSYDNQSSLNPVDQDTRRRLEQLSHSEDSWISEESAEALQLLAEQALKPNLSWPSAARR